MSETPESNPHKRIIDSVSCLFDILTLALSQLENMQKQFKNLSDILQEFAKVASVIAEAEKEILARHAFGGIKKDETRH